MKKFYCETAPPGGYPHGPFAHSPSGWPYCRSAIERGEFEGGLTGFLDAALFNNPQLDWTYGALIDLAHLVRRTGEWDGRKLKVRPTERDVDVSAGIAWERRCSWKPRKTRRYWWRVGEAGLPMGSRRRSPAMSDVRGVMDCLKRVGCRSEFTAVGEALKLPVSKAKNLVQRVYQERSET